MTATKVNGIMCGTGEYTTGFVHSSGSKSDKKVGVVGLCLFELRRLGKVGNLGLVGTTGKKFRAIRNHLERNIRDCYNGLDVAVATFPADDVERDPTAYKAALDTLRPGDFCTIFTPDDTHFDIALYAIERGIHTLLTKPAVMTLAEHMRLLKAAREKSVFVMVEFHKRFDPIYMDARAKARSFGDFGYFSAYMSQPKFQLDTFRAWAGKSSDISYYLNSHHIDVHCWINEGRARPERVVAMGSTGVGESAPYNLPRGTEDTITLMCQWRNVGSGSLGTAMYTSSWAAAAKAEVHSQQWFHYMGHSGELRVDQAHRGYHVADDADGYRAVNPLYMSYAADQDGNFAGHAGYGYRSIATFVETCIAVNSGAMDCEPGHLPTLAKTTYVTAILEAGRLSLDHGGKSVEVVYESSAAAALPVSLRVA